MRPRQRLGNRSGFLAVRPNDRCFDLVTVDPRWTQAGTKYPRVYPRTANYITRLVSSATQMEGITSFPPYRERSYTYERPPFPLLGLSPSLPTSLPRC